MALTLIAAAPVSGWRIRAIFDSSFSTTGFTIARKDGASCSIVVRTAFAYPTAATDGAGELCLSEPLSDGVTYLVKHTSNTGGVEVTWQTPQQDPGSSQNLDDPEAEIFGVDLAIFRSSPTPDGDCPRRRGIECLPRDLVIRSHLVPGELVDRPKVGAAIQKTVNATMDDDELRETQAKLKAEWNDDDRVDDASPEISLVSGSSDVTFAGHIKTQGIGQIPVRST